MTTNISEEFNEAQKALNSEASRAVSAHDVHTLDSLLQQGASVDHASFNNNTMLIMASIYGDYEVAQLLIEKGAQLELRNGNGHTAVMLAAANGHADIVRLLIEAGADTEASDEGYRKPNMTAYGTARDWAQMSGHDEVVQILAEAPIIRLRRAAEAAAAIEAIERDKAQHVAAISKQQALKGMAGPKIKVKNRPS